MGNFAIDNNDTYSFYVHHLFHRTVILCGAILKAENSVYVKRQTLHNSSYSDYCYLVYKLLGNLLGLPIIVVSEIIPGLESFLPP